VYCGIWLILLVIILVTLIVTKIFNLRHISKRAICITFSIQFINVTIVEDNYTSSSWQVGLLDAASFDTWSFPSRIRVDLAQNVSCWKFTKDIAEIPWSSSINDPDLHPAHCLLFGTVAFKTQKVSQID
jgi:hypothetical protein